MASRLSRLGRPLIASAAAAAALAGGAVVYSRSGKNGALDMPIAPVKRNEDGKIQPPSFATGKSRADQLADLRRSGNPDAHAEYDLLVIGGGATGTGIALDAITRGLKVALVERDDFSSGTSSKSTKLVHGGVRYLEKAFWNLDYSQLELVIEALHERKTFLDIAPHLASSLPILLPLQRWWEAPYYWAGTKAYDLLAGSQGLESSYYMTKRRALAAFPLLRPDNLIGGLVYYDGQQNDSRMNISLALTAMLYGATVLNHVEVTGLEKNASGKICGARVRDVLGGDAGRSDSFVVRAKGVINATGPFADAVEHMDDPSRKPLVAPASGVHIVLPGKLCPNGMGILDAATSDGRVVFVLPWQGYTLAGTTDNPCSIEQNPVASQADVDFILKEVGKLVTEDAPLSRDDVLATWSGIRPLVRNPNAKNTESLVRSHLVTVSPSGLLTCAGGKWTTYRQMAEDAVDEAIRVFNLTPRPVSLPDISGAGLPAFAANGTCSTRALPLLGAHGFSPDLAAQLVEAHGVDADVADHLAHNYGDRAWAVLATSPAAGVRLLPGLPFLEAEVRHGVRTEAACTAADVIARRTRLAFLDVESALRALPRIIDVMAAELGWSTQRQAQEWTDTVAYLRSMGLEQTKMEAMREHVDKAEEKEKAKVVSGKAVAALEGPSGILGELDARETMTHRSSEES